MFEVGIIDFFLYFLKELLDVAMWQYLPMDWWVKNKKNKFISP